MDEENIRIRVKDNGYGMTEEEVSDLNDKIEQPIRHSREYFGLKNLNQRLKLFYGPYYGLHIERNDSGGITVTIKIRKMTVEEYVESHVPLMGGEANPLV
ncbi:MAG: sensor histidine kinase [Eisenbergiella sp.]|uniref:sensor histidine kinase n=1 Tax=Eisenbergiella sp. TaxID=1924109 RepID=UPI0039A184DF